jgi:hypothetical protein
MLVCASKINFCLSNINVPKFERTHLQITILPYIKTIKIILNDNLGLSTAKFRLSCASWLGLIQLRKPFKAFSIISSVVKITFKWYWFAQAMWCLQSHLQTSPPTPQKSYPKFWNAISTFLHR